MLPVAVINPAVLMFPPMTLAALVIVDVADIKPAVKILPPVMLAVADIRPAVLRLPPVTLPTALSCVLTVTMPVPLGVSAILALLAEVCMSSCAESMMAPDNNRLPAVILPVVTVRLEPVMAAPVIAPVAEIKPAVSKLPP